MNTITVQPIAFVSNNRIEAADDEWLSVESVIELAAELPEESLDGIEQFSHIEVLYYFHKSTKVCVGSEHPRENAAYPKVGIFAQRKKDRPNHLGATIATLVRREGRKLYVTHLDAIDQTPILDIKPVFREFLPQDDVVQPNWTHELMNNYW